MPLSISRNDIRNIRCDAIVDPTDGLFSHSGSTDLLIHEAAGAELAKECAKFPLLEEGQAVITPSFEMKNCRYIIHTCGPLYIDGTHDEAKTLRDCYRNSLRLAVENGCASIAFPLIASGTFSFPKGEALRIATDTITDFLLEEEMDVFLLVYDKEAFDTSKKLFRDVADYLETFETPTISQLKKPRRVEKKVLNVGSGLNREIEKAAKEEFEIEEIEHYSSYDLEPLFNAVPDRLESIPEPSAKRSKAPPFDFEPDESFGEYLIRLIDKKGLRDPEVYKRANVSKDNFNKIINGRIRTPKKKTAVALAIALKLDLKGTNDLLGKAGYVLSTSYKFDRIIIYCLKEGIYNIFDINEILYIHDQELMC